jgi:hypothetical protein
MAITLSIMLKGWAFPGKIVISSLEKAEIEALTDYPGLTI